MVTVTLPNDLEDNKQTGWQETLFISEQRITPSIRFRTELEENLSPSIYILNNPNAVELAKNPEKRREVLSTHGISMANNKTVILRDYIFYLFQTKVLAVYRTLDKQVWLLTNSVKRKKYEKVSEQENSPEMRQMKELAIRSLYALGLDYGVVQCGVATGKKYLFLHINPEPLMISNLNEKYIQSIEEYLEQVSQMVHPKEFQLGADPEFVMLSPGGNLLLASKYFPIHGKVGCDAIWIGQNRANKPLVELRPEPAVEPKALVRNLYRCMQHAARKLQGVPCRWLAGALPYKGFPIGGHIHFSGVGLNFKLLRSLDNYLTLPLICLEDSRGIERRPKYGFLGDFRIPTHGGFEYRTPPSWLISPTLTKGVFALAKVIASEYQNLQLEPFKDFELQKAYYTGDKKLLKPYVRKLQADLENLKTYHIYEDYLEPFFKRVKEGKPWNESEDFRKHWQLAPYQKRSRYRN